jgi:hypothetical protein
MQLILSRVIYKQKNQCLVGNPFVKMKTILNSFSVFQKMPTNLALHTNISYLYLPPNILCETPLSHVVQLDSNTPIILEISP